MRVASTSKHGGKMGIQWDLSPSIQITSLSWFISWFTMVTMVSVDAYGWKTWSDDYSILFWVVCNMNFTFPFSWEDIFPNWWTHIFRGVGISPTRYIYIYTFILLIICIWTWTFIRKRGNLWNQLINLQCVLEALGAISHWWLSTTGVTSVGQWWRGQRPERRGAVHGMMVWGFMAISWDIS